ncbi:MAG TPA: hypothetical protein VM008_19080 [Phycisphaerae bacterium]|nr:hypothetical protein [Phycisphaerae bacterium]
MQALAILSILLTWAFCAPICAGLGAWLPRLVNSAPAPPDLADHFFAGFATLLAVLQLWHFLAPINFIPHITLFLAGLLGCITIRRSIISSVASTPKYALLLFALLALWLANRATGPNAEYDAGLYHLQAIKWTETFRIVPGLANLHMRFGFSSTLTLFSAFLDQGFWQGNASHIANGFFLVALAAMIVRAGTRVLTSNTSSLADRTLLFTAPLLIDWALDVQASSDSTDIGAAVLSVLAGYYFLRAFAPDARRTNGFLCVLLAAAAISAKGSTLLLCAPLIAITLILLRRESLPATIAAAAFLLPWTARLTILTGYPLYPNPWPSLDIDWRMPMAKVEWLHNIILNWARWMSYDDTRGHWRWLPIWIHGRLLPPNMLWKCFIPATIGAAAVIVITIRRRWQGSAAWLFAITAAAAIFWFFTAPDPRYSSQIFMLLMATSLALLVQRRAAIITAVLLALAPLISNRSVWIAPPAEGLFHPTPASEVTKITTPTGVQVYVPVPPPGSTFEDRVWNAPLPAAPESEIDVKEVDIPPLRLRHPPKLRDGFTREPDPP